MARMTHLSAVLSALAWVLANGAAPQAAAPVPVVAEPPHVKEVTIDPTANRVVCRRYVPTGSRIAEQRCSTSGAPKSAASEAASEQARRDIAEMRDRQVLREQARTHALAEAARRRGAQ